jgi:hypothetical protein
MNQLASEQVVVEAPLSFTGSAKRLWRVSNSGWVRALIIVPAIATVWSVVVCWYALFGLWLVPYRLMRRSARKRKVTALQHQELLAILQAK